MLGPLEVRTDDGVLADVPGARLRGLLIALALKPGHMVPKASLVDWIWGEHPPADATNALQRLASRLLSAMSGARLVSPSHVIAIDTNISQALRATGGA
ncbi:helix-turn-helix domain-containing protein [Pseudofrankia sp. BMG5.37]|nr:helix-turn-helix domain-containing protein [Pseudofrankia sp. BMG5.37]MDT3439823.1 helix-turn-helix domain-containing protein [Pseudofrankia sp. BMG5.37]